MTAGGYLRIKVRARLLSQGIEIQDQETVVVDYDVTVGKGTKIGRNVHLLGKTVIGSNCEIGPDTTLRNYVVGDYCMIGRGSWTNQVFRASSRASDKLAAEHRYFRRPHFLILEEPNYCFVILPFHEPYKSLLVNVIRPVVQGHGFDCHIADRAEPGVIADDIWTGINRASLVIAEVSEDNMNVWYELGLAHALNKKVVILRRVGSTRDPLPFDVAHQRVVLYDPEKGDLLSFLEAWIAKTEDIGTAPTSGS